MTPIPITDATADLDLARCRVIAAMAHALDGAADAIETAMTALDACREALGLAVPPSTLAKALACAAAYRTLAQQARETTA